MMAVGEARGQSSNMNNKYKPHWFYSNIKLWIILALFVTAMISILALFIVVFRSSPTFMVLPPPSPTLHSPEVLGTIPPTTDAAELQAEQIIPTSSPQIYVVQPGDTLSGIAMIYGVSVQAIRTANSLSSDLIAIGQQLIIPVNPALASTAEVSVFVTLSVSGTLDPRQYQVQNGDTLENIATSHGILAEDLRNANFMIGDALLEGQFILLPYSTPVLPPAWRFSTIEGNLDQGYPLVFVTDRFNLHYQANTLPAQDPEALARFELQALTFLEGRIGLALPYPYDVFVAGTIFEPPNRALRGRGRSVLRQTFFLHDGTGNPDDQLYIMTHELTHLFMWNTVGSPSSTMIGEGMAVFTGMEMISDSAHLPLETFCAAYLQASSLPSVSSTSTSYLGHIHDLQNYYAAGCFVKYLVNTYGMESLKLVYHSGDYPGVYGKDLYTLENDWRMYLATVSIPAAVNPAQMVGAVTDLEGIYNSFFSSFVGTPVQLTAYRSLDQARIALLQGNLLKMRQLLDAFKNL